MKLDNSLRWLQFYLPQKELENAMENLVVEAGRWRSGGIAGG